MVEKSIFPILVNKENASDDEYVITEVTRKDGDYVKKGETIVYESSKTVHEIGGSFGWICIL